MAALYRHMLSCVHNHICVSDLPTSQFVPSAHAMINPGWGWTIKPFCKAESSPSSGQETDLARSKYESQTEGWSSTAVPDINDPLGWVDDDGGDDDF